VPQKLRPREQSNRFGYSSLDTCDLWALVLRIGSAQKSVFELSRELAPLVENSISSAQSTNEFSSLVDKQIRPGSVQKHAILGMYELLLRQKTENIPSLRYTTPAALVELFRHLRTKQQEYVYGVYLSPRLQIVHTELLTKGTTDSVLIDARDVLYFGIKFRSRQFVLIHNHPSGDPKPSSEDIEQTKRIVSAAELLTMKLIDHIIIAKEGYFSFHEFTSVL